MKTLFLYLATATALFAQPVSTPDNLAPPADAPKPLMPPGPISPSADTTASATPANPNIPSANFAPPRYETLWTKSPFSVETPEGSVETSQEYLLVGIANIDGVSYASVVQSEPPQEHFLISSDKPTNGLTLSTITRNHDGSETYANVLKDGQTLTLKLQAAPVATTAVGAPNGMPIMNPMSSMTPGSIAPNIRMPGSTPTGPGSMRPFPRIHRPTINLPNRSLQQAPPPPPPQPSSAAH